MKNVIIVQVICFIVGGVLMIASPARSWEEMDIVSILGQITFILGGIFLYPLLSLYNWIRK